MALCIWPDIMLTGGLILIFKVESWNPLTDTVPIHSWIHPWLPLMQARLEPLYSPIRNKLANALQKWHPSDSSAKLILQPWKDVFTPGSWEAFMVKNIVPKLGERRQTALRSWHLLVATFPSRLKKACVNLAVVLSHIIL